RREDVAQDHARFEKAMAEVRGTANSAKEAALVREIEDGYQRYRAELSEGSAPATSRPPDLARWADAHPIRYLQQPCQELRRLNEDEMNKTALESEEVSRRAQTAMLLAGLLGPVSGLIVGYGIARGLSRSIARL